MWKLLEGEARSGSLRVAPITVLNLHSCNYGTTYVMKAQKYTTLGAMDWQ